jgi:hypothetical protein
MSEIERFPPKMLTIFDKPLVHMMPAFLTGNRLRNKYAGTAEYSLQHRSGFVATAITVRSDERLAKFLEADLADRTLCKALHERLDGAVASKMLSALYRRLGVKAGDETTGLLEGSLDSFGSDDIGRASGLWRPLEVSPAVLALACRKLINTAIYPPKPAEVRAACKEAHDKLFFAQQGAESVVEQVRKADAILLEFAHEQWEQPWLMPQYRPALPRMLELHRDCGWEYQCDDDDEDELNRFERLVEAEQTKLAIAEAPQPRKIAASRNKRVAIKRSRSAARKCD